MRSSFLVLALIAAAPVAASAAPSTPPPSTPPPSTPSPVAPPPAALPPALTIGSPSEAVPVAPPVGVREVPREPRSPLSAFLVTSGSSALATLIGGAMSAGSGGSGWPLAIGLVGGPYAGWIYAGRPLSGLPTAGVRILGAYLARKGPFGPAEGNHFELGLLLLGGGILADWIAVPVAVSADNQRARAALVPVPVAHRGGGGLAIAGSF